MRRILAVFAVLILSLPCGAIDVAKKNQVANRPPGYCCWASLETLGRHHNIKVLFDLVEKRTNDPDSYIWTWSGWVFLPKNAGFESTVREKLDTLKVKFQYQSTGNFDIAILKNATKYGVVVGVKAGALCPGSGSHAIVLTHYDDEKVEFYDPNTQGDTWQAPREWFDFWWDGMAIFVPPQ